MKTYPETYPLFISHSWTYSNQYEKLVRLLREKPGFGFKNYSVPKDDPVHTNGTDKQLREAIKQKMRPCNVVLILAGVYASYSKWINKEIDIAKKDYKKSIIAVEPWGSEKTSLLVKGSADEIVGWKTESIVNAIRKLG